MSQENVEAVKEMLEAFNRDPPSALEWLDPDIEWDTRAVDFPELSGVYRGIDGVRRFWATWFQAIEDYQLKVTEIIDGDDAVVVIHDTSGRGRASGITIERHWFTVYKLRDRKVVLFRLYRDKSEALAAVGLQQ